MSPPANQINVGEPVTFTIFGDVKLTDVCLLKASGLALGSSVPCTSASATGTFLSAGEKAVTLIVTATNGNQVLSRTVLIEVLPSDYEPPPTKVTVQNVPTVRITPTPLPVTVENFPQPNEGDGWKQSDRENLQHVRFETRRNAQNTVLASGFALFALAGLVVLALPKVRG